MTSTGLRTDTGPGAESVSWFGGLERRALRAALYWMLVFGITQNGFHESAEMSLRGATAAVCGMIALAGLAISAHRPAR